MNENCWFNKSCNLADTAECTEYCTKYYKIKYLMDLANIPSNNQRIIELRPIKANVEAFTKLNKVKSDINKFTSNGYNLFISEPGSTIISKQWAIKIMQSYINTIWAESELVSRTYIFYVPELVNMLMEKISDNSDDFTKLKKIMQDADLLIWDFLPVTNLTQYQRSQLLTLLDERLNKNKSNIITSANNIDYIQNNLGTDFISRLDRFIHIELKYQTMGGDQANDFFTDN